MSIKRPGQENQKIRVTIPCGKCMACLSRKRNAWAFRLQNEARDSKTSVFVTLTYDVDHVPVSEYNAPTLLKRDIQLFLKRLRKEIKKHSDTPVRYFIVGEYGPTTLRPHYHGLIFNLPYTDKANEVKLKNILVTCWKNGFVQLGTVTDASIQYCTKYLITKESLLQDREKEFALMSRNPGLGISYLTNEVIEFHNNSKIKRFYTVLRGGTKTALPRYYSDKIFGQKAKEEHKKQCQEQIDKTYQEFIENTPDAFNNELQNKIQQTEKILNRVTKNSKL